VKKAYRDAIHARAKILREPGESNLVLRKIRSLNQNEIVVGANDFKGSLKLVGDELREERQCRTAPSFSFKVGENARDLPLAAREHRFDGFDTQREMKIAGDPRGIEPQTAPSHS
jgi:hypothetical protein